MCEPQSIWRTILRVSLLYLSMISLIYHLFEVEEQIFFSLCILATFFALISTTTFDFLPIFLCLHFVLHTNLEMFYRGYMKFKKHAHTFWKYSTLFL